MIPLLDNPVWHSLSGVQAHFASGTANARRYARGFSPIVGFADVLNPDFAGLAAFCEPGEHFYSDGWSGTAPQGWQVDAESTMFKMIWHATLPAVDETLVAVRLTSEHVTQALDLATLTKPGPFGPRTIELGEYYGCFEGERLVAMAGERMHAGDFREVSGVCTHPDFQGRGLAQRLMEKIVRLQMQRGQTPFLHVMSENTGAHSLYQRMGFRDYRESVVRVLSRR